MSKSPKKISKAQQRLKWHHLCYLLVVFNLAMISAMFFLSYATEISSSASIAKTNLWSKRIGHFSRLNELASAVSAPASYAFESGNIANERQRLTGAYQAFQQTETAICDDLRSSELSEVTSLFRMLKRVESQVTLMHKTATGVFTELEKNDLEAARVKIAHLDEFLAQSLDFVGIMCEEVRDIQATRFENESARARQHGITETATAGTVCFILLIANWFGIKRAGLMRKRSVSVSPKASANAKKNDQQTKPKSATKRIVTSVAADIRLDCRVLLAEDGPSNQKLISAILNSVGAEVMLAENGQVALDLVSAASGLGDPFDVIIMDMGMPVLDGYQTTAQLRESGNTSSIIALTARSSSGDREKCLEAGCDDYFAKPVNPDKLIALVAQYAAQDKTADADSV